MSFSPILETMNLDVGKFEPFLKSQIYQNSKLRDSEIVEMVIFETEILPKLTFTQNSVANKFLNF